VRSSAADSIKLETLQTHMVQLRQSVELASLSCKASGQLEQLVAVSQGVLARIAQELILKSLAFEGMRARFDMVREEHDGTFEWGFEGNNDEGGQEEASDAGNSERSQGSRNASDGDKTAGTPESESESTERRDHATAHNADTEDWTCMNDKEPEKYYDPCIEQTKAPRLTHTLHSGLTSANTILSKRGHFLTCAECRSLLETC
jgi:hypothetical protein